jgi:hypothetical protein
VYPKNISVGVPTKSSWVNVSPLAVEIISNGPPNMEPDGWMGRVKKMTVAETAARATRAHKTMRTFPSTAEFPSY